MHFTSNGDWNTMQVSSYRGFLQFYCTTDEFESNNFSSALIVPSGLPDIGTYDKRIFFSYESCGF